MRADAGRREHPLRRVFARIAHGAYAAVLMAAVLAAPAAIAAETGAARCKANGASCPGLVYRGLSYPYAREPGSYLFIDGGIYPYLIATSDLLGDSTVALPDGSPITVGALLDDLGLAGREDERLVPIAGYGSNPAPVQIERKFASEIAEGGLVMPVMKGELDGYDIVWTPFFTDYGAVPSTIFPSPGTTVDIWINWMREKDVERMDATERLGEEWYARVPLTGARYRFEGPHPDSLDVYVSCYGALKLEGGVAAVASVPAGGRRFGGFDEVEVLRAMLPHTGAGSVVSLVHANVDDAAARARNSVSIEGLGTFGEGPFGRDACKKTDRGRHPAQK